MPVCDSNKQKEKAEKPFLLPVLTSLFLPPPAGQPAIHPPFMSQCHYTTSYPKPHACVLLHWAWAGSGKEGKEEKEKWKEKTEGRHGDRGREHFPLIDY